MAVILGYLKCFLKEDFQDVTKKFLPKKQEIERLYYMAVIVKIRQKGYDVIWIGDIAPGVDDIRVFEISQKGGVICVIR
jgi:hypothetical protein